MRSVVAWAVRESGVPYVAAADFADDPPAAPERDAFDRIATLRGATHLTDPHGPAEWRDLARALRAEAAVPIGAPGAPVLATLLVDGDVTPATLAELDAAAGQVAAALAAALSLGRLASLDRDVQRLDRLASLGSLASEIAHEIRNPLVTLTTFVELLPERREDPEFLTRYLAVVREELRRMSRMLDLIGQHAQPVDGRPHRADAGPVMEGVVELLRLRAAQRGVEIHVDGSATGQVVHLGEDALRQVLLNVALNAIDATPAGGAVRFDVRADAHDLHVGVSDDGPGIPPALSEQVFEPFFTTREGNVGGLGLAITRRLIEDAGGSISVAAPTALGTTLNLRLPLVAD